MPELSPQKKKQLEKLIKLFEEGPEAIVEYIFELEDKVDELLPDVKKIIEQVKGDKGDDYVLTEEDKAEIAQYARSLFDDNALALKAASLIKVPLDEIAIKASKLIPKPKDGDTPTKEELEAIIEPLILDAEKIDTDQLVQNASKQASKDIEDKFPKYVEKFRDGLELLTGDDRLDKSAIKDLEEDFKKLYAEIAKLPQSRGGVARGFQLYVDSLKKGMTNYLNLAAGTGVDLNFSTVNGLDTVIVSSSAPAINGHMAFTYFV